MATTRSQSQHNESNNWLPNEILDLILQSLPSLADKSRLSRVNKDFHTRLSPIIYRDILFVKFGYKRDPAQQHHLLPNWNLWPLLRTVLQNENLASYILTFTCRSYSTTKRPVDPKKLSIAQQLRGPPRQKPPFKEPGDHDAPRECKYVTQSRGGKTYRQRICKHDQKDYPHDCLEYYDPFATEMGGLRMKFVDQRYIPTVREPVAPFFQELLEMWDFQSGRDDQLLANMRPHSYVDDILMALLLPKLVNLEKIDMAVLHCCERSENDNPLQDMMRRYQHGKRPFDRIRAFEKLETISRHGCKCRGTWIMPTRFQDCGAHHYDMFYCVEPK